ncbi:unnamed protein product [Lathyrus oleraceus]|uniref:Uncharacterized protein n=1 Tax=Pisum sativum TaxID=3888 RepID=A0A9D4WAN2_PEA|nr:uncharacterized protein LOC127091817 [Pisum sativum]KAI5398072.1 hypothetical protein KIW84_063758 [Pisum sativum]
MENVSLWIQKEDLCGGRDELSEELDSSKSRLSKLIKRSNSHSSVSVNAIQSQISKVFFNGLFFRHGNGLDNRIPKHMVSVDEKYLRRCLELVHNSALKAAQWNNIPMSLRVANIGSISKCLNSDKSIRGNFVFDCPVATEIGGVVMNTDTGEEWGLGSVMESKSMINILNSALLRKFGDSERNENLNRMNFSDAKGLICYNFIDSSSSLSVSSSYNLDNETTPFAQKYGSIPFHKRLASTSSATSTCSDWMSSTSTLSQGMIQCSWKQGIPRFIFSADDQKEVYVANLRKVIDSTDHKALDYVYQFHLNKGGRKGREIADEDLPLVGKMNVSTSFTLCPNNNCRVMETEFTLFQNIEVYDNAFEYSHPVKNKGLKKKVSKVFRTNPSSKHRTLSKFIGSGGVSETCLWDPYTHGGINLLETNVPPNFEMASIVVKDHLPCNKPIGGWGLKFLDKSGANKTASPSESCSQNNDDCSSSMSILVPAGLHGGPRTRNGGPSSLIDRWRSGGHCDCGGWDEGCPLTVLQKKSSKVEVLSHVDTKGECVSVDLVTQGSNDISPALRMVNVHDGLYYIHFHTPLSALQAFSISVAIIHMQSPTLRPKSVQELS